MKPILEQNLQHALEKLSHSTRQSIDVQVAKEALTYENPISFFKDLLRYGCKNGTVPFLIYYRDTHYFYDFYYYEIEEIRQDYEKQTGQPIQIQGDYKNFMAWFSFEYTAYQLCNELGLEI